MTSFVTCDNKDCPNKDKCGRYKEEETCINFSNICWEDNNYQWQLPKEDN